VIGEDGTVIGTSVLRSIPALDQAAVDAVRQWVFEPTVLNGEPVEIEMAVTINFTLQ
jgi:periplasmic protein TonB